MTNEEIKQKAERYADAKLEKGICIHRESEIDAYIAGAHSRDEEIEELKERLKYADESIADADKWIAKYKLELDQLRNPWISVEDRLPRIGQSCFLANFDNRRCGYGKFCADDGVLTRWERKEGGSTMIYCLHEVTHWMPIPELKGGEK